MNRIILKKPLKSTGGMYDWAFDWEELPYNELLPIDEKAELKRDNIPIKNEKINPIPHSTTA